MYRKNQLFIVKKLWHIVILGVIKLDIHCYLLCITKKWY